MEAIKKWDLQKSTLSKVTKPKRIYDLEASIILFETKKV